MKNLVNFKVAVKTRECLVQAIYQMLFNDDSVAKVIDQFKDEHKNKKVNGANIRLIVSKMKL